MALACRFNDRPQGSETRHPRTAGSRHAISYRCAGGWGNTWSTRCAAICDIRRAPHEGQKPRSLPLKVSSLSWPQSRQRILRKPWARCRIQGRCRTHHGRIAADRRRQRLRPVRRKSQRVAVQGGTARSARVGGAHSGPGRHRNAPSRSGERWLARAGHGESGVVQRLRARGPTHSPLGGSATPGATATGLQRRGTLPGGAAAGNAVATTARWHPRHDLSIDPGRRFPRPRKAVD